MKKFVPLAFVLALAVGFSAALSGFRMWNSSIEKEISDVLDLDVSGGTELLHQDSHGGFHGDGMTFAVFRLSNHPVPAGSGWKPLPFSRNVTALAYGITAGNSSFGPYLAEETGKPLLPEAENGFYYFLDRHPQQCGNGWDDQDVLTRGSFNFTLAVLDSDTHTLYYAKLDT